MPVIDARKAGHIQPQEQPQQQQTVKKQQKQPPHIDADQSDLYGGGDYALRRGGDSSFMPSSNWFLTLSGVLVLLLLLNWIRKTKGLTIKRRFNYLFKKIGFWGETK